MEFNIKEEPPVHYVLILPPRSDDETEEHQREVDGLLESDLVAQNPELENPQTEELQEPSLQYPQALQSDSSSDFPQTVSNIKEEPPVKFEMIPPPGSDVETEEHQREVDELLESDLAAQNSELDKPQTEELQEPSLQYPQALQSDSSSDASQTVSNIKEETPVHYVLILPPRSDDDPFGIKQCSVNLQQFDADWKRAATSSETFKACGGCELITRSEKTFQDHKKGCRQEMKCKYCNKKFSRKTSFGAHKNAKSIKCQPCKAEFKCRSLWTEHKQQHHHEGFKCDQCGWIGKTKGSFNRHYQSHSKKFSCETCGGRFSLKQQVKQHQMQHRHGAFESSELSFGCSQCKKTYRTKHRLSEHKFRSHQGQSLECDLCGGILKNMWTMVRHLKTHIEEECRFCAMMIIKSRMPVHINSEHIKSERSMSCNYCGKRFLHKGTFKSHINAKPINCPSCEVSFKCRDSWKQHEKEQHPNGFKCIQCSYVGKSAKVLRMHLKSHAKKFSCVSCHKKFAYEQTLDEHQKNYKHGVFDNTEVEALPCNKCEKVFRTTRGLREHKKRSHAFRNVECDICGRILKKCSLIRHFKTHTVE